jgi:tetratricopeptide (TPR) repeat protein
MKQLFIYILTFFVLNPLFAQNVDSLLQANQQLVKERKYATAYKQLEVFDRYNKNVEVVLAKLDLALNYFATSIMHQFFGFADLEKGQSLDSLRTKSAGTYDLYILKADLVLDSLLKHHPEDFRLNKALGDFFYEVYLRYNDQWLMTPQELLIKIDENYLKAVTGEVADFETYFVLGYVRIGEKRYQEATGFLYKSIQLNPEYPAAWYNMAFALINLDQHEEALEYAKEAYRKYEDTMMKADATRLISLAYDEMGNVKEAVKWLGEGLRLVPGSFYHLRDLVDICVREKLVLLDSVMVEFFLVAPDNPAVYNSMIDIFVAHNFDLDYLISFFRSMMPVFPDFDKVQGNLYYFTGMLEFESNPAKAKETFLTAKKYLQKVYPPENEVFKYIDQYLAKE